MMFTSNQQITVPDDPASPQATPAYLTLHMEEATVTELQHQLGLSKLTLLPRLESLVARDDIQRTEERHVSQ